MDVNGSSCFKSPNVNPPSPSLPALCPSSILSAQDLQLSVGRLPRDDSQILGKGQKPAENDEKSVGQKIVCIYIYVLYVFYVLYVCVLYVCVLYVYVLYVYSYVYVYIYTVYVCVSVYIYICFYTYIYICIYIY